MSFEQFDLSHSLLKAIEDLGFEEPSEIQTQAIPVLMNHQGDFVGQAQTGTGKTAAFVLPLLSQIDEASSDVQAMVLAPTRELANQVFEEVKKLSRHTKIKSTAIYGGMPYNKQLNDLKKKKPHIIIGTPGRTIDLITRGALRLEACQVLVIDEADEMLQMGFLEEVKTIIGALHETRRLWMFSATMPKPISDLVKKTFSKPKKIHIKKKTLSNASVEQYYCTVPKRHWVEAFELMISDIDDCYGVVFCETRANTRDLAARLIKRGLSGVALHGELDQKQRDAAMQRFKKKDVRFLICTDMAARGIDVAHVTHVFNMGLPTQDDVYVHRIGRTGRAGSKGIAINFLSPRSRRKREILEKFTGQPMTEMKLPEPHILKQNIVHREIAHLMNMADRVRNKDPRFRVDDVFVDFLEAFKGLKKEDILKVLFAYRFNNDMRHIDEVLTRIQGDDKKDSKKSRKSSRRRSEGSDSRRNGPRKDSDKTTRSSKRDDDLKRDKPRKNDKKKSRTTSKDTDSSQRKVTKETKKPKRQKKKTTKGPSKSSQKKRPNARKADGSKNRKRHK